MKKYDYIEDYIEVIAGLRDPDTLKPMPLPWFSPIIQLARYDISVLSSMSEHTFSGGALTEKQGQLAIKIVNKYQRQLLKFSIDVSLSNLSNFRQPLRVIDQTRFVDVTDDSIDIKFPYDQKRIDELREFAKTSQGHCRWSKESHLWNLALTESNLNWAVAWGKSHGMEISNRAQEYMSLIVELETSVQPMMLTLSNDKFEITHATDSLIGYINDHCGGFDKENLLKLIDVSANLGVSVDDKLVSELKSRVGEKVVDLFLHKSMVVKENDISKIVPVIVDYAKATDRFPIVIYEPNLSNRLLTEISKFIDQEKILVSSNKKKYEDLSSAQVIHSIKPVGPKNLPRIPLLITTQGLTIGGERQLQLQAAEKVVYLGVDVYNNKRASPVEVRISDAYQ